MLIQRRVRSLHTVIGIGALGAAVLALAPNPIQAQQAPPEAPAIPSTLKGVKPQLPDLTEYVQDEQALRILGKALFWDIQVGSDGNACASCHFHAGADIRTKNQVNPGLLAGDSTFNRRPGLPSGPNQQYTAADFPFHQLKDPSNRESQVAFDTNDVFSSQGTFAGDFVSANRGHKRILTSGFASYFITLHRGLVPTEKCNLTFDPTNPFHANNLIFRKVEPRQTPSTVNAVYFPRQFWDGRANRDFNGVDPFGPRTYKTFDTATGTGNKNARGTGVLVKDTSGAVRLVQPLIQNASLASQAVGPPLSDFEMSCSGRVFADLGRKLIPLRPLAGQQVAWDDSVFGNRFGLVGLFRGINTNYRSLIQTAFKSKYWQSPGLFVIDAATGAITPSATGFTMMEHNFSLFWGLAIHAYEATLISDDAPFDRGSAAMSAQANEGFGLFVGKGKCVSCHSGPLFSNAAQPQPAVEGMLMGDGKAALYDEGFYNIGVRPTAEDLGVGRKDPYGFDLSVSRQYKWKLLGKDNLAPDRFNVDACKFETAVFPGNCASPPRFTDPAATPRDAVDGAFKTPILRNIGLTPPYFHNGGTATLKDVVRFYNRGGDRRGPLGNDTTGLAEQTPFGQVNKSNLDPDIGDASAVSRNNSLGLTEAEMDKIVAFLLSLTDRRVACHAGVFDHPELPLFMGHLNQAASWGSVKAKDIVRTLPAVGRQGYWTCFPNTGDLFNMQGTFQSILR